MCAQPRGATDARLFDTFSTWASQRLGRVGNIALAWAKKADNTFRMGCPGPTGMKFRGQECPKSTGPVVNGPAWW